MNSVAQRNRAKLLPADALLQRFPRWTVAHWCVTVFALTFLLAAVLPAGRLNDFEVSNGAEAVRVARSLAARGAFADPFAAMATGSTAHVAPVYPFLYSLILRALGTGYTALLTAWACNVALFAMTMGLLPLLSRQLALGIVPGIIAAGLGTLSLDTPIDGRWESFLAGALLLVTYLLTDRAVQHMHVATTFAAGGLWGLLILTNPVFVVLLLVWPLCLFLPRATGRRGLYRRLAMIICVALLVVSPWIVRNYLRFDSFIFVRDNLGLELYTGNNPCAAPDLKTNIQSGCHARTHPNPSATVAAKIAAVGEVPFNRAKLHEALDWISTHRAAFLNLTLRRVRLFWFPNAERAWEAVMVWIVTLLSIPGLWLIRSKNRAAAWVIGTAWLLFPLVYYVVPFEPRYRYPIYWTSLLPAGCVFAAALGKLRFRSAASSEGHANVL